MTITRMIGRRGRVVTFASVALLVVSTAVIVEAFGGVVHHAHSSSIVKGVGGSWTSATTPAFAGVVVQHQQQHQHPNRRAKTTIMHDSGSSVEESFFARSLREAQKRRGLPDKLLDSSLSTDEFTSLANKQKKQHDGGTSSFSSEIEKPKKGGGGYKRIEEWDAENNAKGGKHGWEHKVQFDGQRFGDQYRQNEILNRFLR